MSGRRYSVIHVRVIPSIPAGSQGDTDFDNDARIKTLISFNSTIYNDAIQSAGWDLNNQIPAGWYFGEEFPLGNSNINYIITLDPDANESDIAAALNSLLDFGAGAPGNNGEPDRAGIINALPNTGKLVDYTLNLGQVQTTEFKSIFPIINITGVPDFINNFLNLITGHGKLSYYFWIAVTCYCGYKLINSPNGSKQFYFWLTMLLISIRMLWDAYNIQKSIK